MNSLRGQKLIWNINESNEMKLKQMVLFLEVFLVKNE